MEYPPVAALKGVFLNKSTTLNLKPSFLHFEIPKQK